MINGEKNYKKNLEPCSSTKHLSIESEMDIMVWTDKM